MITKTILRSKNTLALLLVDIQKGLDDWKYYGGNRNNPDAEKNAAKLLKRFRKLNFPLFHIKHGSTNPHSPLHPSKPGFQIKDEVNPLIEEPVLIKNVNSGFIGTDLESQLRERGIEQLVIVGLTTNHCISSTVRMGANLGFDIFVISDATATFDRKGINGDLYTSQLLHETSLASLNEEFATVLDTNTLLNILS